MEITVAFRCPAGCDEQRINFDNLDDLLGNLSESGWPICRECGEDTRHQILSPDYTQKGMNVQELINELIQVKDKEQTVVGCIRGVEISETLIVGVKSEEPNVAMDDQGGRFSVCWLLFLQDSSVHTT